MDSSVACGFRLGIPKPVECRLPGGDGGVGAERQCISDRGVINQRIVEWQPPHLLRFRMEDSTLYFRPSIRSLVDTFELESISDTATRLTRTTQIGATGFAPTFKAVVMSAGLKVIHRYVFDNWSRTLEHSARSRKTA